MTAASFHTDSQGDQCALYLGGRWQLGDAPDGDALQAVIPPDCQHLDLITEQLESWDSSLAIALLQLARWCDSQKISLNTDAVPQGLQQLLNLATGVPVYQTEAAEKSDNAITILRNALKQQWHELRDTLIFVGDACVALGHWLQGRAKTRRVDIFFFIDQAGPRALAIVTLISVLVGMILAYLGSVQLRQLGAQVYVADLVAIGMVREMGALMTAVIMAGRTGAAYAAQLGTMQVNEEIDALRIELWPQFGCSRHGGHQRGGKGDCLFGSGGCCLQYPVRQTRNLTHGEASIYRSARPHHRLRPPRRAGASTV